MNSDSPLPPGPQRTGASCSYRLMYGRYGGPELLSWSPLGDAGLGPPGRGRLTVRVSAISINPVDWKIMAGEQGLLSGGRFPRVFGSDFAGTVSEAGPGCRHSPGDRVFGMISPLRRGSGQQFLQIRDELCMRTPDYLSDEEAASLPAAGISAMLAVRILEKTRKSGPGAPRVLVIGAAGGVGSLAVQLLAAGGWEVHAVARPEQVAMLESLGCRHFLPREDWEKHARSLAPWDGILDSPAALMDSSPGKLLGRGGCYAPVYIPNPRIASQLLRLLVWPLRGLHSGMLLAYPSPGRLKKLKEQIDERMLLPQLHRVFSASDCVLALETAMKGSLSGKVVISLP